MLAVDNNALTKVDEMRRRVGADPEPLATQKRFTGRDAASLPVRSRDVNGRIRAMWIAEGGEKRDRSVETKLERTSGASEQILERLCVSRIGFARRQRYWGRCGRQGEVHPVAAGRPDI